MLNSVSQNSFSWFWSPFGPLHYISCHVAEKVPHIFSSFVPSILYPSTLHSVVVSLNLNQQCIYNDPQQGMSTGSPWALDRGASPATVCCADNNLNSNPKHCLKESKHIYASRKNVCQPIQVRTKWKKRDSKGDRSRRQRYEEEKHKKYSGQDFHKNFIDHLLHPRHIHCHATQPLSK